MTTKLHNILLAEIAAHGPLTISAFMRHCLLHPTAGYYTTQNVFGRQGDFITAPEISQMFGELLGLWCVDQWMQRGQPSPFTLLELGGGRGTLMRDALRAAQMRPAFLDALQLYMVEASPSLQAQQHEAVKPHQPHFITNLDDLPPQATFMIANEFFDALPIDQYRLQDGKWQQRMVNAEDDNLIFDYRAIASEHVPALVRSRTTDAISNKALMPAQAGISSKHKQDPRFREDEVPINDRKTKTDQWWEYNTDAISIMHKLATHIKRHGGAAVIIDYGYSAPTAGDSLQAVSHHHYISPLKNVGACDITAHVDFAALTDVATQTGCRTMFSTQSEFLLGLGITQRAQQLNDLSTLHRLTDSTQMGHLFKVLQMFV